MASLWNIMEHLVPAILLIAGSLNVVAGYHVVESTMTWADASAYCSANFGSTLATFSTDAEALELRTMMDASSKGNFWLGLNDLASEGTWVFESGYDCGGNCDSIQEWNSGEPNDAGVGEDCGHFWPSGTTFKMNDAQCSWSGPPAFICDDAATTTDPTADPTTDPTTDPSADPTTEPTEFHCTAHGCDALTVCDAVSGQCVRDCDVLHIDEFLTDCSVEWESQETTISTMTADIVSNTEGITSNDANIATNAANIANIQLVLDKLEVFGAHSSVGTVDTPTAADLVDAGSWTAVTLSGKDVVIVTMLAVNVVLITSLAIVYCRKQRGLVKYEAVCVASN